MIELERKENRKQKKNGTKIVVATAAAIFVPFLLYLSRNYDEKNRKIQDSFVQNIERGKFENKV